jgi:hypothetical protein
MMAMPMALMKKAVSICMSLSRFAGGAGHTPRYDFAVQNAALRPLFDSLHCSGLTCGRRSGSTPCAVIAAPKNVKKVAEIVLRMAQTGRSYSDSD